MRSRFLATLPYLFLLAACSGQDPAGPPPTTGTLGITVAGLASTPASIVVTGPAGFEKAITRTATLTSLVPGLYTITASNITMAGTTYVATPPVATVDVGASVTSAEATVAYFIAGQVANVLVTPGTSELVITSGTAAPSVQLLAALADVTGTTLSGPLVTWSSDNAAIASVDATGLVTASGTGRARVTATAGGVSGHAVIIVGPPAAVAGSWSFTMKGMGTYGSCGSQGTILISQATSDPAFTATVRQSGGCGGGGTLGNWLLSFPALLTISGNVAVDSIFFTAYPCSYHGTVFHAPADSMGGTATCTRRPGDSFPPFSIVGPWSAVRIGP